MQRVDTEGRDPAQFRKQDMDVREKPPESNPVGSDWSEDDVNAAIGRDTQRRWPWVLLGVVVFAAVALGLTTRGSDPSPAEPSSAATVNTAEVVTADLVEVDTFGGTLGRVPEDPIVTLRSGVLTFVAGAGDVIDNGDVMYRVEGDPVILMAGEAPPYRDLALASGTSTVSSGVGGTITAAPEVGTVIDQGDVIYEINGEPVVALYGITPAYRTLQDLSDDMTGNDVAQFEEALAALGYTDFTVDDTFSNATESAVTEWQDDIGANDDGVVNLGEIYFIPGPSIVTSAPTVGTQVGSSQPVLTLATEPLSSGLDVAQLEAALTDLGYGDALTVDETFSLETRDAVLAWQADVGADTDGIVNLGEVYFSDSAIRVSDQLSSIGSTVGNGSPILSITAADIVVKVDLPADDQGLVSVGDSVTVELPSNDKVPATVDSVATVATFDQQGNAIFEVVISLDDPTAAAGLDEAPVDVEIVSDSVSGVTAVPVSSLVALAEGGYAVEVDQGDGTTTLVAVEPGFYADGLVEVTETQLQPGMMVVVP
ncbi:MAG: hypothetical protein HKN91_01875 [Acidimicrobiia bacterium]|nr:hypothetical protein [Acidimicrobiia bacterium]